MIEFMTGQGALPLILVMLLLARVWIGFCVLRFSQSSQIFSHERNWHKIGQKLSNLQNFNSWVIIIDQNTNLFQSDECQMASFV